MSEDEQRMVDAIWVLRQLVNQALVEKGIEAEEEVAGVPVVPATSQIDLSPPHLNAAIEELLELGALVRDDETDEIDGLLGSIPGAPGAVKITREGLVLMSSAGA
jgi:hypothetical protein